jgi:hypothetical protein
MYRQAAGHPTGEEELLRQQLLGFNQWQAERLQPFRRFL